MLRDKLKIKTKTLLHLLDFSLISKYTFKMYFTALGTFFSISHFFVELVGPQLDSFFKVDTHFIFYSWQGKLYNVALALQVMCSLKINKMLSKWDQYNTHVVSY